jgi:uncharacterized membrane protein YeaQ/YmgE (transglycosylase-associated protein family)
MNSQQKEFVIWVLKIVSAGLVGPLSVNYLQWLTGADFPKLFYLISSILSALIGLIILCIIYKYLLEENKWTR